MTENTAKFTGLSAIEISEINAEMSCYADKTAVSIEALKIVQKHRRWVSDEALVAIANLLGVSSAQLEGVATFYNLIYRKPVGKSVILYCNSVSCWMMGAEGVRERLCRHLNVELGEMTADSNYTVLPIVCLGACDHAPVVMIDKELKLNITEENAVDAILGVRQ